MATTEKELSTNSDTHSAPHLIHQHNLLTLNQITIRRGHLYLILSLKSLTYSRRYFVHIEYL